MKKVFDYAVIYNGVFYPANTPIEVEDATETKAVKENVEKRTSGKSKARNSAD